MKFEWDNNKNQDSINKHGVSFEEAKTAFYDDYLLGKSWKTHILTVCHCYRKQGDVVRIISARKATKNEKKQYIEQGGIL